MLCPNKLSQIDRRWTADFADFEARRRAATLARGSHR
jgi:hypothetical protein